MPKGSTLLLCGAIAFAIADLVWWFGWWDLRRRGL